MQVESQPAVQLKPANFISYIEGMRGLFGLVVVAGHFRFLLDANDLLYGPTASLIPGRLMFLTLGGSLVCWFMVISGFVLTIPIALRGSFGGFWAFLKRRARRMVPPFYAAIAVSVPLYIWGLAMAGRPIGFKSIAAQVVSHLLFVHNFSGATLEGLNGAMWSIAVEWQAYLLFAVLLIPLQRRFGLLGMIVAGFGIGLLPTILALRWNVPYGLRVSHFWYFGIFALGSAAAFVAFDATERYRVLRNATLWKIAAALSAAYYLFLIVPVYGKQIVHTTPPDDIAFGLVLASLMLAAALDERAGKPRAFVVRLLASRPLVWFGTFSYSLYLTHQPFVEVIMAKAQVLPPATRVWVPIVATPFLILFAYGFAMIFEFPFLSSFYRAGEKKALAGDGHAATSVDRTSVVTGDERAREDHDRVRASRGAAAAPVESASIVVSGGGGE